MPVRYEWKPAGMRVELLGFLFPKIDPEMMKSLCGTAAHVLPILSSQRANSISIGSLRSGRNASL